MNMKLHKNLMAGAIAALLASPAWAAEDAQGYPAAPSRTDTGQPMEAAPPMDRDPGYAQPGTASGESPLYTLTPVELKREEVVDTTGAKVGTVKKVVASHDRASAHAVISSGGVMGIGATDIVVPLDELQPMGDKLQASGTRETLESNPEYVPEDYVELDPGRPISEFSAFEPKPEKSDPAGVPAPLQ
jgi:sporulation protein YlmC with PRC-barrel domain